MRYCPKCKSFYDDEHLGFCLNDGVPLVSIDQTDTMWNDGTTAIRLSRQVLRRKTRRLQISRFMYISITTILVIMVVNVVVLNSWIYFGTPADEIVDIQTPASVLDSSMPRPSRPVAEAGIQPGASVTPTPESAPDPDKGSTPVPSLPAASPAVLASPTRTPQEPDQCTTENRQRAEQRIVAEYGPTWREHFLRGQNKALIRALREKTPQIFQQCQATQDMPACVGETFKIVLADSPVSRSFSFNESCTGVTATIRYEWRIIELHGGTLAMRQMEERSFRYPNSR